MIIENGILSGQLFNQIAKHFHFKTTLEENVNFTFQQIIDILIATEDVVAINDFINLVNENTNLYSLSEQKWPDDGKQLSNELFGSKYYNLVNKKTPIVSMGSCFAVEIAKWLQRNEYNYLVTEPNLIEGDNVHASSAKWGTIFNSAGFYQVVKWAFGYGKPPHAIYPSGKNYRDAFREDILYRDDELNKIDVIWDSHLICSKKALEKAEVLILTVGLNEIFEYIPTGDILHRNPWSMNVALWRKKILTVDENIEFLQLGLDILRKFNPDVKIILSVSPVPLMRSFRQDCHVVTATAHSKAVLRVALEKFVERNQDVYYMPSYETVMYPGSTLFSWEEDGRHVSSYIVDKIMNLFQLMFCGVKGQLNSSWWNVDEKNKENIFFDMDSEIINESLVKLVEGGKISLNFAQDFIKKISHSLRLNQYREDVYLTMRALACQTGFEFTNNARVLYRAKNLVTYNSEINEIVNILDSDGYYVIQTNKLQKEFCIQTLKKLQEKKVTREIDGKLGMLQDLVNDGLKDSFRYFHSEYDFEHNEILNFLEKAGALTVVKAYLGEPILRNINAWHSVVPTSSSLDGNLAAAQLLHHDNDKPLGWVKVFIYLTDVWQDNGPHAYVPSSHKHVPDVLRRDGRFTDAEVIEHYPEIRTITGECGTIIIGDTQCLHKGTEPLTGQRSILQLEFCNSLLGAEDNNTNYKDGTLLECYKRYSIRMMSRYIKSDRINYD